jgi:serine/threonine protein kinase
VLYNQITWFYLSALFDLWFHFPLGRKNSRYSEKDAAVVVRQMLKVAAECHLCGLVHRDMKPEVENRTLSISLYIACIW